MTPIAEIEQVAMLLPISERVALASKLLRSLPNTPGNDFDEFELARKRDAAMDSDPARQMSEDELDAKLLQRFSYLADETNS